MERDIYLIATAQRPNCSYNKGYIAYFTVHAQNGHISTPCLKSNVTVVLLNPDFLQDAGISAIPP